MLLQLVLHAHQHVFLPWLQGYPDPDPGLNEFRENALACRHPHLPAAFLREIEAILPENLATTPLGCAVFRRSPSVGIVGPAQLRPAIAMALTMLVLDPRESRDIQDVILVDLLPATGVTLPEEVFDVIVKARAALLELKGPTFNPVDLHLLASTFRGPHQSSKAPGILNLLDDLNPWRDPQPRGWRQRGPQKDPVTPILERSAPTLLAYLYQPCPSGEAMGRVLQALRDLCDREGIHSVDSALAQGIMQTKVLRERATHPGWWHPDFREHLGVYSG